MDPQNPPGDSGPPSWATYIAFTLITFAASMVGGCINRQEALQKHDQVLGKIEELRADFNRQRERNR